MHALLYSRRELETIADQDSERIDLVVIKRWQCHTANFSWNLTKQWLIILQRHYLKQFLKDMVYNDLMFVRSLRCNRIGGSKKAARVSSAAVQQVASNLWLVFGCGRAMQPRGFSQLAPSGHRPRVIPSISTTYPSAPIPYINHFYSKKTNRNKDHIGRPRELGVERALTFKTLELTNKYRNWYLLRRVLLTLNWSIVLAKLILGLSCVTKAACPRVRWQLWTPHFNYLFK